MAQQDDSLIREVDEEMRRERIEKIWQRYSTLIIAGALLVIGSVGAFQYWQHSQAQARADGTSDYIPGRSSRNQEPKSCEGSGHIILELDC